MKNFFTNLGGFFLGVLFIMLGSYLILPIFKFKTQEIWYEPLIIIVSYVILGLVPIALYFRLLLKAKWSNALLKACKIIFIILILWGIVAYTLAIIITYGQKWH
jgi:hypothetical protein